MIEGSIHPGDFPTPIWHTLAPITTSRITPQSVLVPVKNETGHIDSQAHIKFSNHGQITSKLTTSSASNKVLQQTGSLPDQDNNTVAGSRQVTTKINL